ncbi:transposase [Halomarina rubra]|uniref:transposase n=1 Tax=Halomarina rubra TaxID=2071873 RepID=UPI002032394C
MSDHISRVVGPLDIPIEEFTDRSSRPSVTYDFEPMIRAALYQEICGFSQSELADRLRRWTYLRLRFGLDSPPTQQTLSNFRRNRLSLSDRQRLSELARKVRALALANDVRGISGEDAPPAIEPDEVDATGLTSDKVLRAVRVARDRVFTEFTTSRAANAKYPDEVYWEVQAYLSMTAHGKRAMKRRYKWIHPLKDRPHGDTHTRTIKKIGTPDPQMTLPDYATFRDTDLWKQIRDTLLEPFDRAVANLVEETDFEDQIREPVNVAIDITSWRFYPSPLKSRDPEILKTDYPDMVSGLEGSHERGFLFATLSVVGKDTPIVLAIEPVRENSWWETDGYHTPKAEVVDRLLTKAQEHVEIHKVMADRAFDGYGVRDVIDRHDLTYLIPKANRSVNDAKALAETKAHPDADYAVERGVRQEYEGRVHTTDFIYFPSNENTGKYGIMLTNADVPAERAPGLVAQYRDRWMIENEYKCIKQHFLPQTSSTDYRVRLFYFVAGVLLYNTWRLTNLLLRNWVDVNLGEKPPIPAGEVAQIIVFRLGLGVG